MSDKKEKKNEYIKKDGHIDFDKITRDVHYATLLMRGMTWLLNPRIRWFEFIAYAIVGTAWMSLLMIFVWTGNLFLLKIWATPIVFALILMCIIEGFKALLRKKEKTLFDLINEQQGIDNTNEYKMSRVEFTKLKNSLDTFNNYDKNVEGAVWLNQPRPTYKEYKDYVLSLKPELISHENLIKVWYSMFLHGKWTMAGFNIHDWKLQTKTIMEQFIGEQLNSYINFYSYRKDESGTNKV